MGQDEALAKNEWGSGAPEALGVFFRELCRLVS